MRRPGPGATEGVNPGNLLTKDEPMNVFGAFVSFHALEIGHVSHPGVRVENAFGAKDGGFVINGQKK